MLTSPHLLVLALQPLLLLRHVRLHYPDTLQASSWQQLGFRSEWFLSQTIKLVKMFHLVHKPLTTPSFLLVDVFSFSLALCHPLSVSVCLSFPLCAPCYWGMNSRCSNFTCWQRSLLVFFTLFDAFVKTRALIKTFFLLERNAGWSPFTTYFSMMSTRKSDPWEFIMPARNPVNMS